MQQEPRIMPHNEGFTKREAKRFPATTMMCKLRITEPLLGTVALNSEAYGDYIAKKAPVIERGEDGSVDLKTTDNVVYEEEMDALEVSNGIMDEEYIEEEQRPMTGFLRNETGIYIYNYMIKGQIKAGCDSSMAIGAIDKIVNYKKWMDLLLFVNPRRINIIDETTKQYLKEPDAVFSRSLRSITKKGPRTSIAKSEIVNPGRLIVCEIVVLNNKKGVTMDVVEQALDYGRLVGLGQWRGSGGYGSFEFVEVSQPLEKWV